MEAEILLDGLAQRLLGHLLAGSHASSSTSAAGPSSTAVSGAVRTQLASFLSALMEFGAEKQVGFESVGVPSCVRKSMKMQCLHQGIR